MCVYVCACMHARERQRDRENMRNSGGTQQVFILSLLVNYYLNEDPQSTWHFACSLGEALYKVKYS